MWAIPKIQSRLRVNVANSCRNDELVIGATFSRKIWIKRKSVQGQGEGGGCSPSPTFQVNIFMQFSGVNITHPHPHPKNPAAFKLTNRIWWICKSLVLFIFVARGKLVSFKTTYHEWKVRYHTLAATSFPLVFSGGIVQIVRLCKGYNENKIAMPVAKTKCVQCFLLLIRMLWHPARTPPGI